MTSVKRALCVVALCAAASPLSAQAGSLIKNVNLPISGFGVSVAVDCDGIVYYTLSGDTNLHKMDSDGVDLGSVPVAGEFDELVYDAGRDLFWACLHGSNPVAIYHIEKDGTTTFQWNSATISIGTFRDGIAIDAGDPDDLGDDQILVSGDVSTTIEFHDVGGNLLKVLTPTNAAGGTLGSISGVTVGKGDLLYLGRNGFVEIVQVKKSDGTFLTSFASPGGARDEGLECDPINFAPKLALWSREFNAPGFCSVIELEPETCGCGGVIDPNTPPTCVPPDDQMASVGDNLTLSFTFNDVDGDELQLTSASIPAGAVVVPPVGSTSFPPFNIDVLWTPTNSQTGNINIELCVDEIATPELFGLCCDVDVEVAECHLLIADGRGEDKWIAGGHEFSTNLDGIQTSFPVLLEDIPEFLLPISGNSAIATPAAVTPGAGTIGPDWGNVPAWMADGEFAVQVVMWNPIAAPNQPEQWTYGLHVKISPDGVVRTKPFGDGTGMEVWAETGVNADGKAIVKFPFSIPGF